MVLFESFSRTSASLSLRSRSSSSPLRLLFSAVRSWIFLSLASGPQPVARMQTLHAASAQHNRLPFFHVVTCLSSYEKQLVFIWVFDRSCGRRPHVISTPHISHDSRDVNAPLSL